MMDEGIFAAKVRNVFELLCDWGDKRVKKVKSHLFTFYLDVEFGGIYQSGTECVLDSFVGGIDAQLAEDVFAMGGDGMDAGEAFGSNFLGRLAQSDGFHDFRLGLRQDTGCLVLLLLLGDDGLEGTLAEITGVSIDSIQGFTYFTQRTVLEYYAKLMGGIDYAADELRRKVVADEYPVG